MAHACTLAGHHSEIIAFLSVMFQLSVLLMPRVAYFVIGFLRATAVPAGTAEARISYGNSVCLSVCHGPVQKQPSDIETPGLHHMIA